MALLYMCCYPSPIRIGNYISSTLFMNYVYFTSLGGLSRLQCAIGNLVGGVGGEIIGPTPYLSNQPNVVKVGFHMVVCD